MRKNTIKKIPAREAVNIFSMYSSVSIFLDLLSGKEGVTYQ